MREIYNHYVANSTVTFDEDALTLAEMRKKFKHVADLGYPWLVAVSPRGQRARLRVRDPVEGEGRLPLHRRELDLPRPGVDRQGAGRGADGGAARAVEGGGHQRDGRGDRRPGRRASIRLHERFGFKEVGHMGRVGFKFGRWLGTVLMQKSLK